MILSIRFVAILGIVGHMMLFCSLAPARVILSIDDIAVPAGTTAVVGVYAASDNGDVISGFNLPLDINSDGFIDSNSDNVSDLPNGFSFASPALQNLRYANTGFDMPQPQIGLIEVDGIPTGSGADVLLSSTPTRLFELHVSVAPSVPPGTTVPLQIIVPNSPFQSLFNVAGPNGPTVLAPLAGQPVLGSITIIPEPSSQLAVLSGAILILCGRRRFK